VVIGTGITFWLLKGVLDAFFYACPPVCRVYLLSEPDESKESAYAYEPVHGRGGLAFEPAP